MLFLLECLQLLLLLDTVQCEALGVEGGYVSKQAGQSMREAASWFTLDPFCARFESFRAAQDVGTRI